MRVFGKTDVGLVRKINQDFIFYSRESVGAFPNLFIVADGMGGHNAGDFASRYAVECFLSYIKNSKPDALIRMVDEGIKYANKKIMEKAAEDENLRGMGTTMVVAYIEDGQLFVANIGDSRLYLVDLEPGDQILMCSDGLSNMVEDEVLYDIVKNTYIGDVVDGLIDEAKRNGGSDNIAVIVIDPFDVEVN